MALVKAGADLHGKNSMGSGSRASSSDRLGFRQCRGGRSVHSGVELQGVPVLAVQVHGAALCVV